MGKFLEKLILQYLQLHVDIADAIPHIQAGFRQPHSTETQLTRITRDIHAALEEEKATSMVSIDCTEAFPSVSHPTLLDELRRHKTPPWIHNIIASFLEQRITSFRVTPLSQSYTITPKAL
jgi:hypothetical protein